MKDNLIGLRMRHTNGGSSRQWLAGLVVLVSSLLPWAAVDGGQNICDNCYEWTDSVTGLPDAQCCLVSLPAEYCLFDQNSTAVYLEVQCIIRRTPDLSGWGCDPFAPGCDEVGSGGGSGGGCTKDSTGFCPPECARCF